MGLVLPRGVHSVTTKPVTPSERKRILAALRGGASFYRVAKDLGRHTSTVKRIADKVGVRSNVAPEKTAAATATHRPFDKAHRQEVIAKVIAKAEELLPDITDSTKLVSLSTAIAIMVDKQRLEDGEATSRTETSVVDPRAGVAARLDELAGRRQKAAAS